VVYVLSVGVYGRSIAHQRLVEHALLTQLAVRTAFLWALAGAALLAAYNVRAALDGGRATYLEISAARHAFALGFVTLMIFGVAARALPAFLARRLWSPRLQLATIVLVNAGVALRVVPQAAGAEGALASAIVALSGALAYAALVGFAVNVVRTLRAPVLPPPTRSTPVPITFNAR
ncbi:MAG: NnrS family protein, partial [Chloroflexota bacterium]